MALANTLLLPCIVFYSTLFTVDASACLSDTDEACAAKQALTEDTLPADRMGVELLQTKFSALSEKPNKADDKKSKHAEKADDEKAKRAEKKLKKAIQQIERLNPVEDEESEKKVKAEEKELEEAFEKEAEGEEAKVKATKVDDKEEIEKLEKTLKDVAEEDLDKEFPIPEDDDKQEAKLQEKDSSSESKSAHSKKKDTKKKHKKSSKKHEATSDYALPTVDYMLLAKNKWCNNNFDAEKINHGPEGNGFTLESCKAACSNNALCNAFSFDTEGGWCAAYHRCGSPTGNPNGHWQQTKGWRTYEKVYMPKMYKDEEEEKKEDEKSKKDEHSSSKTDEQSGSADDPQKDKEEAQLKEAAPAPAPPPLPFDPYTLLAKGKWCDLEQGAIEEKMESKQKHGHSFQSCMALCTNSSSCTSFSYDKELKFCSTFANCGTPSKTPNKKSTNGAHQKSTGWVTYKKMDEMEISEQLLKIERKGDEEKEEETFESGLKRDYMKVKNGLWCDVSGDAKKNDDGIAAENYTLEKCKTACARTSSCEAFSFDKAIGWCTTFAQCGHITAQPHRMGEENNSGWVTYLKWSDAPDIAIAEGIAVGADRATSESDSTDDSTAESTDSQDAASSAENSEQATAATSEEQPSTELNAQAAPTPDSAARMEATEAKVAVEQEANAEDPEAAKEVEEEKIAEEQLAKQNLEDPDDDEASESAQEMEQLAAQAFMGGGDTPPQ